MANQDENKALLDLLKKRLTENSASAIDTKAIAKALKGSRKLLDEAILLLEGKPKTDEEIPAKDPEAPYGRKVDGTPKKAPGRATKAKTVE